MKEPRDCVWCGEGIVMLQDQMNRWHPVNVETWTSGETVYDPNVHKRHSCVNKSRGQFRPNVKEEDWSDVVS